MGNLELSLQHIYFLLAQRLGHPLHITHWLEGNNAEPEIIRHTLHLGRAVTALRQVIFEDLNTIKARLGGSFEFLRQGSR